MGSTREYYNAVFLPAVEVPPPLNPRASPVPAMRPLPPATLSLPNKLAHPRGRGAASLQNPSGLRTALRAFARLGGCSVQV